MILALEGRFRERDAVDEDQRDRPLLGGQEIDADERSGGRLLLTAPLAARVSRSALPLLPRRRPS